MLCLALVLAVVAPLVFPSGFAISLLSQIGVAIIGFLSFNILFGQGGMISFGHAIYGGVGGYAVIYLLKANAADFWWLPTTLLPVVGGLAGALAAAVAGLIATRLSGLAFAMITLGLGELTFAISQMFPQTFGGESGLAADRVWGQPLLGITYGPAVQMYYLIVGYCAVCVALMFALTLTPLGRMLEAVRDNAERVSFVGYDTRRIRYLAFVIAGTFAGISGALNALSFEFISVEVFSMARSASYMLFTFIGGAASFFGPVVGAVLYVLAHVLFSEITKAWLLYLGLAFMLMVMYAPAGLVGTMGAMLGVLRGVHARRVTIHSLVRSAALAALIASAVGLIEMIYSVKASTTVDSSAATRVFGFSLNVSAPTPWLMTLAVLVASACALLALAQSSDASSRGSKHSAGAA